MTMLVHQPNEMMNLLDTVEVDSVTSSLQKVSKLQAVIQASLKSGHDYDTIPGTNKPTLLKPGAEKVLMMFGLTSEYEILEQVEDWQKGVFAYTVRCILSRNGVKITEGLGSCNSKEDKYRYRWVFESDLPAGVDKEALKSNGKKFRIENDEIYSLVNTILKMAKKRAQVDATLTVSSLSEIFTQDIEDMKEFIKKEASENMQGSDAVNMKINFGKHKGKTVGQVAAEDLSYIKWLADNAKDSIMKQAAAMVLSGGKSQQPQSREPMPSKVEHKSYDPGDNTVSPPSEEDDFDYGDSGQSFMEFIDSQPPIDYLG